MTNNYHFSKKLQISTFLPNGNPTKKTMLTESIDISSKLPITSS